MIQFAVAFMAMFESCEMLLHNSFLCLVMGRGWGPRYLALKRERGPARVSRLLSEDIMPLYQLTSRPGTMKGHVTSYSLAGRLVLSLGLGRVNLCCVVDRPQHYPLLGDSEVDPTLLCGFTLGWSGKLGEP